MDKFVPEQLKQTEWTKLDIVIIFIVMLFTFGLIFGEIWIQDLGWIGVGASLALVLVLGIIKLGKRLFGDEEDQGNISED